VWGAHVSLVQNLCNLKQLPTRNLVYAAEPSLCHHVVIDKGKVATVSMLYLYSVHKAGNSYPVLIIQTFYGDLPYPIVPTKL
jgi:hypothetical protein